MPQPTLAPAMDGGGPLIWEVLMRMLVKAVFDTAAANEVIASGQAGETTKQMVERLQPEAFYAFGEDGYALSSWCSTWRSRRKYRYLPNPFTSKGRPRSR